MTIPLTDPFKDSVAGRRVFGERMESRRGEKLAGEFKRVERGWYLGDEQFRQELFVDRHLAILQGVELGFVVIYDDDLMSKVGETRSRDQAYVSRTDYRDAHVSDS